MTTIEERAKTIARGVWDARASTGTDTFTALVAIVYKELAADAVRRETTREVEQEKDIIFYDDLSRAMRFAPDGLFTLPPSDI